MSQDELYEALEVLENSVDATANLKEGIASYRKSQAIRAAIVGASNATAEELAEKAGVSVQAFRTKAAKLEKEGVLKSTSVVNDKGDGFRKVYTYVDTETSEQ